MDKSILQELYNGRIFPSERGTKHIVGHGEISHKISVEMEYWKDKFSEEDYKRWTTLESLYSSSSDLEKFDMFCYAFRLATQL